MHVSSSRISSAICIPGNEGAFPSFPIDSFPAESSTPAGSNFKFQESRGRLFMSSSDASDYREHRLPSIASLKRNVKVSLARWRCRHFVKKTSRGVTTFDDFTADLYGNDVDDELPLLEDVYMHNQKSDMAE